MIQRQRTSDLPMNTPKYSKYDVGGNDILFKTDNYNIVYCSVTF